MKYWTAVGIYQRLFSFTCCLILGSYCLLGQSSSLTVGVVSIKADQMSPGFDLLYPNNQSDIFLIDQCGRIVHQWQDEPSWRPGNVAYLLPDGNLVRAKRYFESINDPIWFSGGGEIVELVDWEGNVLWQFYQNDSIRRLHHDIQPMPNGHILLVSWESKSEEEAIANGRDPRKLVEERLLPDYILEVSPEYGDSVIWEWHAWDHLIQDFDASQDNFGTVAGYPERIDLNYDERNGIPDWLHINSIDYNPDLDQILISVLGFNEIWIIDHSTTTAEAAGHTGGRSGKGGDLLFRWGNPFAYRRAPTDGQQLFGQHNAQWLDDLTGDNLFAGDIIVFNNNYKADVSAGHIIHQTFDTSSWSYQTFEAKWLPETFLKTITHPQPSAFQSSSVSSIQLLENGNFLMCAGQRGYTIELDERGNLVWEYILPLRSGFPVAQGTELKLNDNFIFRQERYGFDFPAFTDKNLIPGIYLELNPDSSLCDLTTATIEVDFTKPEIVTYPNPAVDRFAIKSDGDPLGIVMIYNTKGEKLWEKFIKTSETQIAVTDWKPGLYLISIHHGFYKVIIS